MFPYPELFSRAAFLAAVCGLALFATALPALAGGPLDGRTFTGQTGEQGKDTGDAEDFVFANGTFDPLACHEWGFGAAAYRATAEGDAISFEAEHTNADGDRMQWVGRVVGDELSGTMTYWHGDDPAKEYWFRGTPKSE